MQSVCTYDPYLRKKKKKTSQKFYDLKDSYALVEA